MEEFDVPGVAIGVIVDGEIVTSKGYGLRNEKDPVDTQTLFAIGSCTKAFTTYVLSELVKEGSLEWDRPVIDYLPHFRLKNDYATSHITVRDLVTHTSGLPAHNWIWYHSPLSREEFLSLLPHLDPICGLRQRWNYNNLMYLVAGLVAEKVTGKTWEESVADHIFSPLEMKSSNFSPEASKQTENYAQPTSDGEVIPFTNLEMIGPAGSINSNLEEMMKWSQHQLSLSNDEMHRIQFPIDRPYNQRLSLLGYGLGWFIGLYDHDKVLYHDGSSDGFRSRVLLLPEKKIGIVILTNSSSAGHRAYNAISFSLLDKLLELDQVDWIEKYRDWGIPVEEKIEGEKTAPSHPLEAYIGKYQHPGYGVIEVKLKNEKLFAYYHEIEFPLTHQMQDHFEGVYPLEGLSFPFKFITSDTGTITALEVTCEKGIPPISFIAINS